MIELQNIELIKIPVNPERDWIWTRILISIDYFVLKPPTALQWSLLRVLTNLDKLKEEVTTELIATKLAVEKSIIEEGLTNLIEEHVITLQPRKKASNLQNYILEGHMPETFKKYELITHLKQNKKILLFYDFKDERTYNYQLVEKPEDDEEEELDESVFELVLLALIEQIWKDLENHPHSLAGEIDYSFIKEHKLLKDLQSILLETIHVNFL